MKVEIEMTNEQDANSTATAESLESSKDAAQNKRIPDLDDGRWAERRVPGQSVRWRLAIRNYEISAGQSDHLTLSDSGISPDLAGPPGLYNDRCACGQASVIPFLLDVSLGANRTL